MTAKELLYTHDARHRPLVRSALENAASVAGLMLTTECLIATRSKAS